MKVSITNKLKQRLRITAFVLMLAGLFSSVVLVKDARAQACEVLLATCEGCGTEGLALVPAEHQFTTEIIEQYLTRKFNLHRSDFIVKTFWEANLLPALMMMADQFSAVAMQQTQIIGSFMDAKHQMETQRVLQTIRARAHKDYHPSAGMCEFGTSVKSLAASERKAELNAHVMSQRSQDRNLGNVNVAASIGPEGDHESRLKQFQKTFCDPTDNNLGLKQLCKHDGGIGAAINERKNKDIDFARTFEYPWTLNVDFTDSELTHNEEEIIALSNNLYGHNVFKRVTDAMNFFPIEVPLRGNTAYESIRSTYMDSRALLAKRSVAENSFNAITSLKSAGTAGSRDFLESLLLELGISDEHPDYEPHDLKRTLGFDDQNEEIGPSYYAQMEILTKKIYQNPDFYTNLYDKPANVERKKVAMQAIGLMQKFDLFKSYLRNEASLSVLLELAVSDLQARVENEALAPN